MRVNKECPFSGVTNSGRFLGRVPESEAFESAYINNGTPRRCREDAALATDRLQVRILLLAVTFFVISSGSGQWIQVLQMKNETRGSVCYRPARVKGPTATEKTSP